MSEKILKAGAIILSKEDNNKIALLFRSKQNDWSFPKGHIEKGEHAEGAMIREIKEEIGLPVHIIRALPDLNYENEKEGVISIKMFLVVSDDDSQMKLEFKNDKIEWTALDRVVERLSYDNLKNYFRSVLPLIL